MALTQMFGFDHLPDGLVIPKLSDKAQAPYLELVRTMFTLSNVAVPSTISSLNVDGANFKGVKLTSGQGISLNCAAGVVHGFRVTSENFTGFGIQHIEQYWTGNVWGYRGATATAATLGMSASKGSYYLEVVTGAVLGNGYFPFSVYVNGVLKVNAYAVQTCGIAFVNDIIISDLYRCVGGITAGITFPMGSVRVKTSAPSEIINESNLLPVNTNDPAHVELGKVWVNGKTSKDSYCLIDKPGIESTIKFPALSENVIASMIEVQTSRGSASASTITLTAGDATGNKDPLTYTPAGHASGLPDIKNFMFDKQILAADTGAIQVKVKC